MLNMVSTVDGHATLGGRSGPLCEPRRPRAVPRAARGRRRGHGRCGHRARRALRQDHPRRVAPPAEASSGASARSRSPASSPGASRCAADIPLLADPAARVVILTPSAASLPESAAEVHYVRAERDGLLDLPSGVRRAARALRRAHAAVRGRTAPERTAARRRAGGRAVPLARSHARGRRPGGRRRGAADRRRAPNWSPRSSWSC